jgi:hypothetical protein
MRRNAEEWARLIREMERSGQSAVTFARARGIRPDTLKWWCWRLKRGAKTSSRPRSTASVKLIAVRPLEVPASSERGATPVWELVAPTGYELRVYDRRGLAVLRAALSAVASSRRR